MIQFAAETIGPTALSPTVVIWLEVIKLAGTIVTLGITAWLTVRLAEVKTNVDKIEKATNSMKDALVESTAKENLAVGVGQGIEQERTRSENKGESVS